MKKTRIMALILSITLLSAAFAGCGTKTGDSASSSSTKMDTSPITLTLYDADATEDMPFTDDVAKEITKETGVTLKITHPVAGDTQAIPLMIASGDYPDLIYAKNDTAKLVDAGAIIKLNDYIDKSGNYLKALYGSQLSRLSYSPTDSSIYTAGTYGVTNQVLNPSGTVQIQNAVLKELGYSKITSLTDYENAIKTYMAKYPKINGQKTIGITLLASDWRWLITCGNIGSLTAGIADDGQFKIDDNTGKATYKFELPEVEQYFKWLNHINAEGLLDPESFTQKEDTYKAKIASGAVLGLTDSYWEYNPYQTALVGEGMPERTYAPLAVTSSPKFKAQDLKDYGFSGGWGVAISSSSKNKDRAFQFLNWLASDKAQVLLNWGVKGKDYTIVNGKRQFTPEIQNMKNNDKDFSKKTGISEYLTPFPERGIGAVDSTGDSYSSTTLASVMANYNSAEKETIKAYGKKSWLDFFPSAQELGASKHGQVWQYNIASDSDIAMIQKKADDYTQKAITQAILGKESDFDGAWNTIQQTIKSYGIDKVDSEITKMTKDRLKQWSKK